MTIIVKYIIAGTLISNLTSNLLMSYYWYMDSDMINRIDFVLDRVIESESGLSIAQIGLVKRIRYSEKKNKLLVFTKAFSQTHGCCTLLALTQQSQILNHLEEEFKKEFPEHLIELVNVI